MDTANGEDIGISLCDFIHDYGAQDHLTYDGAALQVGCKNIVLDTQCHNHIRLH